MIYKEIICDQGTDEWFAARLGKWTASNFSKIVTTTGKPSTQAKTQNSILVSENILGEKQENNFTSEAMDRGNELEAEALNFINFTQGFNFRSCGFLDSEKGFGCSPDAIDEEKKIGLEIKCPLPHTHLQYLLNNKIPSTYIAQVQGSMLVSGFDKWIFCSYHPTLKSLVLVIERDEIFLGALKVGLEKNCGIITEQVAKLEKLLTE